MIEKIKFGDIKADIKENIKVNELNRYSESDWAHHDSSLWVIGSSFYKVLPEKYVGELNKKIYTKVEEYGEAYKKYIEDTFSLKSDKERTAIEFGGPGSKLFSGFTKGLFKKTVGVCLDDVRSSSIEKTDDLAGHSVVIGDITDTTNKDLFQEIYDKLGTEKVDLIISRMQAPLDELKRNPAILNRIIRKWYKLLDDNGILFAQYEYLPEHNPDMEQKYNAEINPPRKKEAEKNVELWADAIKLKYPNEIEIQLGRGVIRLVKKDNAPAELMLNDELFKVE